MGGPQRHEVPTTQPSPDVKDHFSPGENAGGEGDEGGVAPDLPLPSFDEWKQKEQEKSKNSEGTFNSYLLCP